MALIRARIGENSEAISSPVPTEVESFQQDACWDVTLENDIISISRTSKSEVTSLESRNLNQARWTLHASISACKTLYVFQGENSKEDFMSLSREITGENWIAVSHEVCSNALGAEFEALTDSRRIEGQDQSECRTEVFAITYTANQNKFVVIGRQGEFWEVSEPDLTLTLSEMCEIMGLDEHFGAVGHIIWRLSMLTPKELGALVAKVRSIHSPLIASEFDLVCGTSLVNLNPPRIRDFLLPLSWRAK